jgi:hypothetical protein
VQLFVRWVIPNIESDLTDREALDHLWSYNRHPARAAVSFKQQLFWVMRELG